MARNDGSDIVSIELVDIAFPECTDEGRRPSWHSYAPRGLPINRYYPADIPQKTPGFSSTERWIRVVVRNGKWGLGQCSFGDLVEGLVYRHFSPLLIGKDALAIESLNDLMTRSIRRHGARGLSVFVQSAIDLALWDIKGRILEEPVYRLIGGPARDTISCYATCDDLDWAQELGFRSFKISNAVFYDQGWEGLAIIEEKVARARSEIGDDVELMFNPVMAFNVRFAIEVANILKPYRLSWIEEPLIPDNLRGYVELKRAIPWMAIATGEDHHNKESFLELIENRAVDVVQPDLRWCGGLTEALKIYAIAEAAGIPVLPHAACNSVYGQHFSYAMPECNVGEFHISSPVGVSLDKYNRIPGMAVPRNGKLRPTDGWGFGLKVPLEWIRKV